MAGALPCSCIETCCPQVGESPVGGLSQGLAMLWGADSALHLCHDKGLGLLLWRSTGVCLGLQPWAAGARAERGAPRPQICAGVVGESLQRPQLRDSRDSLRPEEPSGIPHPKNTRWEQKVLLPPDSQRKSSSEQVGWGCAWHSSALPLCIGMWVVLHRH